MEVEEEQVEVKEDQLEVNEEQLDVKVKDDEIEEKEIKCEEEIATEREKIEEEKEQKHQIKDENLVDEQSSVLEGFQEPEIEENAKKTMFDDDLEIPDTMEVIQVTEMLPPKVNEEFVEDVKPLSPPMTDQEIVPDEIKPKSPSPVSTMTCSIDGNNDTEGIIPVAAQALGTIKINISQKITSVKSNAPAEDTSLFVESQSSQDFIPAFSEFDPDQPPPPGLEMETVIATKVQKEMKPRLMNNVKKIKEYPMLNRGKEMSGLCSIM